MLTKSQSQISQIIITGKSDLSNPMYPQLFSLSVRPPGELKKPRLGKKQTWLMQEVEDECMWKHQVTMIMMMMIMMVMMMI